MSAQDAARSIEGRFLREKGIGSTKAGKCQEGLASVPKVVRVPACSVQYFVLSTFGVNGILPSWLALLPGSAKDEVGAMR